MAVDRVAFLRDLHGEHASALWRFALSLTGGDRDRAQDVVQETLLRAWQSPRVLDVPDGARRAWLFTVARHIVIDDWRSARSRRELLAADPPEPLGRETTDETDAILQAWLVADALERLSQEHRRVLVESYYRGRSAADTARVLGIPEGTVKSRLHYGLRALRLVLEEMGVVL